MRRVIINEGANASINENLFQLAFAGKESLAGGWLTFNLDRLCTP